MPLRVSFVLSMWVSLCLWLIFFYVLLGRLKGILLLSSRGRSHSYGVGTEVYSIGGIVRFDPMYIEPTLKGHLMQMVYIFSLFQPSRYLVYLLYPTGFNHSTPTLSMSTPTSHRTHPRHPSMAPSVAKPSTLDIHRSCDITTACQGLTRRRKSILKGRISAYPYGYAFLFNQTPKNCLIVPELLGIKISDCNTSWLLKYNFVVLV